GPKWTKATICLAVGSYVIRLQPLATGGESACLVQVVPSHVHVSFRRTRRRPAVRGWRLGQRRARSKGRRGNGGRGTGGVGRRQQRLLLTIAVIAMTVKAPSPKPTSSK